MGLVAEVIGEAALIAATRFEADPLDAGLAQNLDHLVPAWRGVAHLERLWAAVDGQIERCLADIHASGGEPARVRDAVGAALEEFLGRQRDVLAAMDADAGQSRASLKVDGGAAANNYLMQSQADLCGCTVLRPRCVETTAAGAAYLAGLAVGFWGSVEEIRSLWAEDRAFVPELPPERRREMLALWQKAVACAAGWAKP